MSEHMPALQPRPPDVERDPAACRCHADAPAEVVPEPEACRCHLLDAAGLAEPQNQRIPESAWQPARVPTPPGSGVPEPAARTHRFRTALAAVILAPALAGAVVLVVSGLVPVLVVALALFLPALVPLVVVGLAILFTGELRPTQEERAAPGRLLPEPVPARRPVPAVS